mmetsp:Transcript_4962/g.7523  ORF Transcript_4962/g.7523 Transcript_4962/m.7523 type:complete len:210 (-) Transcript_4962:90-719(-)
MVVMKKVSILYFIPEAHRFSSTIHIEDDARPDDDSNSNSDNEFLPSTTWTEEYKKWNILANAGYPEFRSLSEIRNFNAKGAELSSVLRQELGTQAYVQPFLPIYSNMSIGSSALAGFWHLRDDNYGFPVSIQKLPISDALKGAFIRWFLRLESTWEWLDQRAVQEQLNTEGYELQTKLSEELNADEVQLVNALGNIAIFRDRRSITTAV